MIHKRYLANIEKQLKYHYRTENINAEEKNKVRNKIDTNKNLKFACKIKMKSQI